MRVSWAITVHNEGESLNNLLEQLVTFIEDTETDDEIIILDDFSDDYDTISILESYSEEYSFIKVSQRALERDFGAQKTYLNSLCTGDYIFQIDADERLAVELLYNLHSILEANPTIDLYYIPRINTVEGLTEEHIKTWGWYVNKDGWIMFPDYQSRLYRNSPEIIWVGKVHERIDGIETFTYLPPEEKFCILHYKEIHRQEQQNKFYSSIIQETMNEQ